MDLRSGSKRNEKSKRAVKTNSQRRRPVAVEAQKHKRHAKRTTELPAVHNDDAELRALYAELSDEEEAHCVPHGNKTIECFICGEQMRKIYKLRAHLKMHENVGSYDEKRLEAAPIYEALNPQRRNIETSVIRDFLVTELQAKRHSQFYGILSEASVELHYSDSETLSEGDDEGCAAVPRRSYKCELCAVSFERRYMALFHQKTAHPDSGALPLACDYCDRRFTGLQLLVHHLKTQCESDERPIGFLERFQQHLLHTNLEQFKCLAQARAELKRHRLSTAERVYGCDICQKSFLRSEHLTRHKSVHLPDVLKMECPVCFKKFNRKDNLHTHMKVHLDEAERDASNNQQILCQYCGDCFTSKSNYVVHMRRRHTGEKPYACETCGKGFATTSDLRAHRTTHAKQTDFVCSICQTTFSRAALLEKHQRTHSSYFNCSYCTQSFQQPSELARHLRSHCSAEVDANDTDNDTSTAPVEATSNVLLTK